MMKACVKRSGIRSLHLSVQYLKALIPKSWLILVYNSPHHKNKVDSQAPIVGETFSENSIYLIYDSKLTTSGESTFSSNLLKCCVGASGSAITGRPLRSIEAGKWT